MAKAKRNKKYIVRRPCFYEGVYYEPAIPDLATAYFPPDKVVPRKNFISEDEAEDVEINEDLAKKEIEDILKHEDVTHHEYKALCDGLNVLTITERVKALRNFVKMRDWGNAKRDAYVRFENLGVAKSNIDKMVKKYETSKKFNGEELLKEVEKYIVEKKIDQSRKID